jgi:WD40 repeat protein
VTDRPTDPADEAETERLWSWSDADAEAPWPSLGPLDRYVRGAVLSDSPMSTVQLAQDPLLRRQVVLKTVSAGRDAPAARRLLREARITAALDLPGVARVLDAGSSPGGEAWFAMPVLAGETLAARREAGAAPDGLLAHLLRAARILAPAHDAGIVHRDIKLDNMLVDAAGAVTLLDWGIARPESASEDWDAVLSAADQTAVGQVLGTPASMSPEQVIGAAIDRRADVWALGVCLVELVSGEPPFARETPADTIRAVVHAAPAALPGALGAVAARCLQRDPAARLPDARAFADALEAALRPAQVAAPSSPVHKDPRVLMALAAAVVSGALGGVALTRAAVPSPATPPSTATPGVRHAALVRSAAAAALAGDRATAELLAAEGLGLREDPSLRGILAAKTFPLVRLGSSPMPDCERLVRSPDARWLVCVGGGETLAIDARSGDVAWRKPLALTQLGFADQTLLGWTREDVGSRTFHLPTGEGSTDRVVFDSGGRLVASAEPNIAGILTHESFRLAELRTRDRVTLSGKFQQAIVLAGGPVVTLNREELETWTLEGARVGAPIPRLRVSDSDTAWAIDASADGRWLVSGSLAGVVREWDLERGVMERVHLPEGMVRDVAISRDGAWIAAVDETSRAWLWRRGEAATRMQVPGEAVRVGFPTSGTLVTIGELRTVWRLPDPSQVGQHGLPSGVTGVDWRGPWAAAALGDGSVRRWRPGRAGMDRASVVEGNVVKDVALGADGAVLAGSSEAEQPSRWLWSGDGDAPPAFNECRRVLWLEGDQGVCQPMGPGPEVAHPDGTTYPALLRPVPVLVDTEATPDRTRAVLMDAEGEVWMLTAGTPPDVRSLAETSGPGPVALASDDTLYVGHGATVEITGAGGGRAARLVAPDRVLDLAVNAPGDLVAGGLADGRVVIWDTRTSDVLGLLIGHRERVSSVAFDDRGDQLLTGSWDDTVRTWDLGVLRAPAPRLIEQTQARWGATAAEALSW